LASGEDSPSDSADDQEGIADSDAAEVGPHKSQGSIPDDQVDQVRQMAESMTDDEIALELGVSRDTVFRYRRKHGIEKPRGPRGNKDRTAYEWEPWQKQRLVEMKLAGRSYGEIAEAVGKSRSQCSGMWFWEKKKLAPDASAQPEQSVSDGPAEVEVAAKDEEAAGIREMLTEREPEIGVNDHASRPKPSPIDPSDWPDIRQMLADGRSLEAIAGDYDVSVSELEDFVEEREKQSSERRVVLAEAKSPSGESLALSASNAGSAE
jgi:transposase-like protein